MSSDATWGKIEKAASEIVEKTDGEITKEAAVDRVLKTAEGRALYAEYMGEYYRERALGG